MNPKTMTLPPKRQLRPQPENGGRMPREDRSSAGILPGSTASRLESPRSKARTKPAAKPRRQRGAQAIQLWLRVVGKVKPLTPLAQIALAVHVRNGDKKACEQMIKANLPLVVANARDYEGSGMPLIDLVSAGNLGLLTAAEWFDMAKEKELAAYSSWWIRRSIELALAGQSRIARQPDHPPERTAVRCKPAIPAQRCGLYLSKP